MAGDLDGDAVWCPVDVHGDVGEVACLGDVVTGGLLAGCGGPGGDLRRVDGFGGGGIGDLVGVATTARTGR
ncbi:MAG: hypothetical protein U5R31_16620 [Acidimicrobiia bacterium]|nr:hypothetical protein [Acidimicrobiia bacterium]